MPHVSQEMRECRASVRAVRHDQLVSLCTRIVEAQAAEPRQMRMWRCKWCSVCNYGPKGVTARVDVTAPSIESAYNGCARSMNLLGRAFSWEPVSRVVHLSGEAWRFLWWHCKKQQQSLPCCVSCPELLAQSNCAIFVALPKARC